MLNNKYSLLYLKVKGLKSRLLTDLIRLPGRRPSGIGCTIERAEVMRDLGSALAICHLLHVLDGLESEHRGYKMKNAELFRNGQTKPEVLKETWVEQFPALAGFTVPG